MQFIIVLISILAVAANAWEYSKAGGFKAGSCESISDKTKCTSSSCAWCESGAVGDSCLDVNDAESLPASVFTCEMPKATVAAVPTFKCGDHNNDCLGCIQMSDNVVSQCTYCPVDQVCHTVGSLFNKCSNDECISLCKTSSCKKKTAADCDNVNSYKGLGNKKVKGSSCEDMSSEDKCSADSSCAWCESAAVGNSCMDAADAKDLPSAVFTCKLPKAIYKAVKSTDPALPTLPDQYKQEDMSVDVRTNAGAPPHVTQEISATYYDFDKQFSRTDVKTSSYGEPGPYTVISDYNKMYTMNCGKMYEDMQVPRQYMIVGDSCCYADMVQDCPAIGPQAPIPMASTMMKPVMPTKIEFDGAATHDIYPTKTTDLWSNIIWLGQQVPVIANYFYFDSSDHETQLANFLNVNAGPQFINATTTYNGPWTLGPQDASLFDYSQYDCSKLCQGAQAQALNGANPWYIASQAAAAKRN